MNSDEFGFSVVASWIANHLPVLLERKGEASESEAPTVPYEEIVQNRKFEVFDVYLDMEQMLPLIKEPVAHILVETSPSNFYNLACLVVESKLTSEWYVFKRGRIALQGSGGGAAQTRIALEALRKSGASVSAWAIDKETIDQLEHGIILWPSVKTGIVPLMASVSKEQGWKLIQERAAKILKEIM